MDTKDTNATKAMIEAQANASRSGLNWAKANLGSEALASTRDKIIEGRVRMRRISEALDVNPAAAVFGQSQVGKSYLVKNLLKNDEGALEVVTDCRGGVHNFIGDLNPSGGGKESTGLITRFTVRSAEAENEDFPISVSLFSPVDITLILTDSYFCDIDGPAYPELPEIERRISTLEAAYSRKPEVQKLIGEDQVYEMIDYVAHNSFSAVGAFIRDLHKCRYLERLSAIIGAIPPTGWCDAFSLLWNDNPMVSDVYARLIALLETLGWARRVGINVNPLLRVDGTILSVDRIKEFFGVEQDDDNVKVEKARVPDMQVRAADKTLTVSKSEFTAVAAEVILRVPQAVAQTKPFLADLDILDFPGARSREVFKEANMERRHVCNMLLRGRVSYLFNKYSRQYLISTLLFCHHEEQSDVKSLSGLLQNWISDMVGATPDLRAGYMSGTRVPPLFIVSTKFNRDLNRNDETEIEGTAPDKLLYEADQRWERRYTTTLTDIIKEDKDNRWFSEWMPGTPFDNLYLLRDYSFSKQVFEGYLQHRRESGVLEAEKAHLERLRGSFLNHEFVRSHFRDPHTAWERAATPNADGSEYIIENLVVAAGHVVSARNRNFARMVADNFHTLFDTLFAFYHDDNSDTMLAQALESAGRIELTLGILFGTKPYLFTELLSSMLVNEESLHGHILDVAQEIKSLEKTDMNILFAIRERAKVDPSLPFADNMNRLLATYHLRSQDELSDYLNNFGFTIQDVINPPSVQNLPQIVAEALEAYWVDHNINASHLERFTKEGMPESSLQDIVNNLKALYFDKLHITDRIIERIRPYVTTPARLATMAEMLADMVAEMFNKFVNTFGTAYFSPELWEDVAQTVEHNDFKVEVNPTDYNNATLDEDKLREDMNIVFDVFENIDKILNNVPVESDKLAYFSNYHNFRNWTQNMKIGFLATCEIPKYDVNMNNELRAILLRNIFESKAMRPLIDKSPRLVSIEREMRAAIRD